MWHVVKIPVWPPGPTWRKNRSFNAQHARASTRWTLTFYIHNPAVMANTGIVLLFMTQIGRYAPNKIKKALKRAMVVLLTLLTPTLKKIIH